MRFFEVSSSGAWHLFDAEQSCHNMNAINYIINNKGSEIR